MSDTLTVRGIVVGHGDMPKGLLDAVHRIAGDQSEKLTAISNSGLSAEDLRMKLDALSGLDPTIMFTDLLGGSGGIAAAYSCRDAAERVVVCGVNLPMLLEFIFHCDLPLNELADRVADTGRGAIRSTSADI
jgi:mannose/fructose-specific phosphotransferase system component IIA